MFKFLPDVARLVLLGQRAFQATSAWIMANGLWWASSVAGHVVVLSAVLLILGKVTAPVEEGEAPAFESKVDTELRTPDLDHFEVGETPLEPSESTPKRLRSSMRPQIEGGATDGTEAVAAGGGSAASATGGMGGLDQFAVKALGAGPLVRGSGLAAAGKGTGPGSGGGGSGFGRGAIKTRARQWSAATAARKPPSARSARALNWFKRHQNPDGSWSIDGYSQYCKGEPCGGDGKAKNADPAATAMALLPFLAAEKRRSHNGARVPIGWSCATGSIGSSCTRKPTAISRARRHDV